MTIYDELLGHIKIPSFYRLKQHLDDTRIEDIEAAVNTTLDGRGVLERIKPGDSVAVAVGSREIKNLKLIVKTLCDRLKERKANPFIIPAMGSHGGSIAENQTALIAHFGITEREMGVPIRSRMETVVLGKTQSGVDIHFDRNASEADAIIPVGRVKVHTCYRYEIESGLIKMLVVGCGKQKGASAMHSKGFAALPGNILDAGRIILKRVPVVFGLGILENARHETLQIKAIPAETMEQEEKEMLTKAREIMPRLPFSKIDILLIDEMGKNIAGTGIDPNVTGRSTVRGRWEPNAERIVIFDLTDESDGSAYGLGNADLITKRLFSKINFDNTYPNSVTNNDLAAIMTPAVMPCDRDAIRFSISSSLGIDKSIGPRIVWIHNTLCVDEFYISEGLKPFAEGREGITVGKGPLNIAFDEDGNISALK